MQSPHVFVDSPASIVNDTSLRTLDKTGIFITLVNIVLTMKVNTSEYYNE